MASQQDMIDAQNMLRVVSGMNPRSIGSDPAATTQERIKQAMNTMPSHTSGSTCHACGQAMPQSMQPPMPMPQAQANQPSYAQSLPPESIARERANWESLNALPRDDRQNARAAYPGQPSMPPQSQSADTVSSFSSWRNPQPQTTPWGYHTDQPVKEAAVAGGEFSDAFQKATQQMTMLLQTMATQLQEFSTVTAQMNSQLSHGKHYV